MCTPCRSFLQDIVACFQEGCFDGIAKDQGAQEGHNDTKKEHKIALPCYPPLHEKLLREMDHSFMAQVNSIGKGGYMSRNFTIEFIQDAGWADGGRHQGAISDGYQGKAKDRGVKGHRVRTEKISYGDQPEPNQQKKIPLPRYAVPDTRIELKQAGQAYSDQEPVQTGLERIIDPFIPLDPKHVCILEGQYLSKPAADPDHDSKYE